MLHLEDVRAPRPRPRPVIRRDLSVIALLGKGVDPVVELGQRGRGISKRRVCAVRPPYRMVVVVAQSNSGRPAPPGPQSSYVGSQRRAVDRPPPVTAIRVSQHVDVALERHQVAPSEVPPQQPVAPSEVPFQDTAGPSRPGESAPSETMNDVPRSSRRHPGDAPESPRGSRKPSRQGRFVRIVASERLHHGDQGSQPTPSQSARRHSIRVARGTGMANRPPHSRT